MGREKPITNIALLPLCRPSNTGPFLLRCHFVAVVLPRFTIVLTNEIRVKKMGEREVRHVAGLSFGHSFSSPCLAKLWVRQTGAIMYALENIDFSDRLGFVVSTPQPDEIDSQDQTLETKSTLPTSALEEAVFGAA